MPSSNVEVWGLIPQADKNISFRSHPQIAEIKGSDQQSLSSRGLMATVTGCYTLSQEFSVQILVTADS